MRLDDSDLATIATAVPFALEAYDDDRSMGGLISIDRAGDVVAVGRVVRGLRTATNVFRQDFTVTRAGRARLKGHLPAGVWLTGLPSAGKSTIADGVEACLNRAGVQTAALDGDNLRHGLTRDLTGIDQAYEAPSDPDIIVGRDGETIGHAVTMVVEALKARGFLQPLDGGAGR